MDIASRRKELNEELAGIQGYLDHPISRAILADIKEQRNMLIQTVLNQDIESIATFFKREQALGHLRGLNRLEALLTEKVDEIKAELAALPGDEYRYGQ